MSKFGPDPAFIKLMQFGGILSTTTNVGHSINRLQQWAKYTAL